MPDFSVVIPLFNKGPHIERALDSVLAQTLRPREIVVVDDGSSDGGYEYVQGLQIEGLIVEQRTAPGPGGYAARNRAIELSSGEWIAFLDADDEWQPGHLASVAATLAASPAPERLVTVFSGYEDIYADGRRRTDPFTRIVGGPIAEMDFLTLLGHWVTLNASPMWTSATVCRRESLVSVGAFPEGRCKRGGDKDTWLRIAHLGMAAYTGAVTANYFRDAVNMTTKRGYANSVPCIVESTRTLAGESSGATQAQLRKLQNLEIYNYALATARNEGLQRSAWKDFDGSIDPLGSAVLTALSNPVGAATASVAYRLMKRLRG